VLVGGAGADVFQFARGAGSDRIVDFARGIDKLDVSSATTMTVRDTAAGVSLVYADGRVIELVGIEPRDVGADLFL
jgi:Ca2+-binding RTX toxin-like protein